MIGTAAKNGDDGLSRRTPLNFFFAGAFFWSTNLPVVLSRVVHAASHHFRPELGALSDSALACIVAGRFVRRHASNPSG
jgi:hypothetical protein